MLATHPMTLWWCGSGGQWRAGTMRWGHVFCSSSLEPPKYPWMDSPSFKVISYWISLLWSYCQVTGCHSCHLILSLMSCHVVAAVGSNGPRKFCLKRYGQPGDLPRSHTWWVSSMQCVSLGVWCGKVSTLYRSFSQLQSCGPPPLHQLPPAEREAEAGCREHGRIRYWVTDALLVAHTQGQLDLRSGRIWKDYLCGTVCCIYCIT